MAVLELIQGQFEPIEHPRIDGQLARSPIIPVIICGGAGTRLWPVSRESMPKQFVPLIGTRSTFQCVLDRVSNPELFARPIVITSVEFRFLVAEQARACNIDVEIVLEPSRRDSGPAIAVAAELVARREPTANVLVLAADHIMANQDAFIAACRDAMSAAASGQIVTFGIPPTSPAVGYGYIRSGRRLDGSKALAVDAFVEKPDAATAARYVAENYLWNSGNFMFRADVMREEVARFEPTMANAAAAAIDAAVKDLDFLRLADQPFAAAPRKSIDYAVMERTDRAAVVPANLGWSDIGSWDAVWAVQERDSHDNVASGPVELLGATECLVHSDGPLTTVVGCDSMVVVATADAVLVVPRDRADQVKSLVAQLKTRNRNEAVEHRRIYRPWGYYQGVDAGDRYQVKRIVVKPAGKLSLQKHYHRAEHWVVVKGTAEVTLGDDIRIVHENESIYLPIGSVHRLANPGKIPLELIEVQVGSYLGEDDIVRIEDVYHRQ
jgi:mannose-1-phosphate guanylyltransferase/mannose-6-phosphate isomerase